MKPRQRLILIGALLLAGLVTYLVVEWRLIRRTNPPQGVTDIHTFMKWRPETQQFVILQTINGEYLMANGEMRGTLPSGPSAYVFDRSGQLVDWSPDIGDAPAFDQRWQAQRSMGSPSTLRASEVKNWMMSK
jgi:hypothetical protein